MNPWRRYRRIVVGSHRQHDWTSAVLNLRPCQNSTNGRVADTVATSERRHSQCSDEGWRSATRTLMITRLGDRLTRDLRICVTPNWIPEVVDPLWSAEFHDLPDNFGSNPPFGWGHASVFDMRRTGAFLNDQLTNDLLHAVDAFPHTQTSGLVAAFASTHDGEATRCQVNALGIRRWT